MFLEFLGLAVAAPFLYLFTGLLRSLVLFYPVMLGLGALHTFVPVVPPLGWAGAFWLVFVVSLLIPTSLNDGD